MKKFFLSLTLALATTGAVLPSVSSPAYAAETAAQKAGRAAIVAAYKKQDVALLKKDINTLASYMAPDYLLYSMNGEVLNRAQSIAKTQMDFNGGVLQIPITYRKCSTKILSLTWRGPDAVVKSETTGVATASQGGRTVRVEVVSMGRDYWGPSSQGWKVRQTVELMTRIWRNGKRIQ